VTLTKAGTMKTECMIMGSRLAANPVDSERFSDLREAVHQTSPELRKGTGQKRVNPEEQRGQRLRPSTLGLLLARERNCLIYLRRERAKAE